MTPRLVVSIINSVEGEVNLKLEYRIKQYRLEKGLSITELAKKCGVSREYMSLIESGKVPNISTRLLVNIAKSLDRKIDDILILQ